MLTSRIFLLLAWASLGAFALYDENEEIALDVALLQTQTAVSANDASSRHASTRQEPVDSDSSTNSTSSAPVGAAEVSGVETNAAGDLYTFLTGLVTNSGMVAACMVGFVVLRQRYPLMFNYNCQRSPEEIRVPDMPVNDWSSWADSALSKTHAEHVKYAGLDHAMLLEFSAMSMRMLWKIGIPMLVIMGTLNFFFGHGDAEKVGDNLSRIAMGNVRVGHPWLYYVYAIIPLIVVWIVRQETMNSMRMFCKSRFLWLKQLKIPQAATVLVEGIPEEYQSDAKVQEYFSRMFSAKDVKAVNVAKNMPELETVYSELQTAVQSLAKVEQEWENAGKPEDARPQIKHMMGSLTGSSEDAMDYWKATIETKSKEVTQYRESVAKDAASGIGGVNGHSGFVTFADCRNARVAASTKFSADRTTWLVSQAPAPKDIIWSDLKVNVELRTAKRIIGYGLVFGLYVAFTPFCLFVTNLATTINLGPFQSLWAAYAPTLGLLIFLSFAPTVLINIFSWLFNLKSEVRSQLELQNWYFWFMLFFVIGVTVVGQHDT